MCTGKKQFSSRPLGQGKTNSFWRKKTHRMSGWRRPDENEDKGWTGIGMSYSQDGSKNKNPKPSTRERPCKVHWTQAWGEERPSRPHHVLWNWPSSSLPWTICPTPKLQNRQEILEQSCRSARMLSKPTSPAHTHTALVYVPLAAVAMWLLNLSFHYHSTIQFRAEVINIERQANASLLYLQKMR
jgi:hypothetical protein